MPVPTAEEVVATAKSRLDPIREAAARGDSEVQRFYEGAVVFVTGGSGFLGKQLVEKLFRTFAIQKLFILLRVKKGKSLQQRLEQILNNPVYDSLRETHPWFVHRIEAIEGDITSHRLGVADDTWQRLIEEVTVVFHSAATISFTEPLKLAIEVNVQGTLEMLEFGKACKNLRSFVHVSTAYSQALNSRVYTDIPEEFSTTPMHPTVLVDLAKMLDRETMDEICPKLLGHEYSNTYMYTKAVAEEAVRTMSADLPICIVRPTIVVSSYTEPSPGWVENISGPSGVILGIGLGVIHTLLTDMDIKIDIIPVDIVNNAIIVAGYETARRREKREKEIMIYTVGSSSRNYIKWSFLTYVLNQDARTHVSALAVWYAFVIQTTNKCLFHILSWILHFIPGIIADVVLILMGKKPAATKVYKQIYKLTSALGYFTCRSWNFRDDNTMLMYRTLSETDKQIFNIDIKTVDMKELILLWHIGSRRYILNESLEDREESRRKQAILKIVTYIAMPVYLYVLFRLVSFVFNGLFYLLLWYCF